MYCRNEKVLLGRETQDFYFGETGVVPWLIAFAGFGAGAFIIKRPGDYKKKDVDEIIAKNGGPKPPEVPPTT